MALTIRIFAEELLCFLRFAAYHCIHNLHFRNGSVVFSVFGTFHGTHNSKFRCGSVVFFVFRSVPWHSKFALSLWICNVFCVSELSMALKILCFAGDLKCFLCFGALTEIILDNITEMSSTIANRKNHDYVTT